jgi:DNA-directed RNA polymerase specialized sigma24 family protein
LYKYLKPLELHAFHLRFETQLTYAGIGAELGKSEQAARKIISRALDRIEKLYLQKYKSPVYSGGEKNDGKE